MAPAAAGLGEAKSDEELDEFVTTLRTQVEIFVNRMKSNSSRGRSIANDSSVQTLFMNAMSMHSQLLKHIQEQEDKRVYYEGLQDKLTQVSEQTNVLLQFKNFTYFQSLLRIHTIIALVKMKMWNEIEPLQYPVQFSSG